MNVSHSVSIGLVIGIGLGGVMVGIIGATVFLTCFRRIRSSQPTQRLAPEDSVGSNFELVQNTRPSIHGNDVYERCVLARSAAYGSVDLDGKEVLTNESAGDGATEPESGTEGQYTYVSRQ